MAKETASKKARILYVDDDEENLKSFKALFRREYEVFLASSAEQGMDILKGNDIQVLITDQRMPGVSGSDLLTRIAGQYPDMIRFMLTGFSDFDPLIEAINKGHLQGYFSKPLDIDSLKTRIESGLKVYYLKVEKQVLAEELQKSEARFRSTFEQAAVGIAHVAPSGEFLLVNRKLCHMLGFDQQELRQCAFNDILISDQLIPDSDRMQALINGQTESLTFENQYKVKDGKIKWADMTFSVVRQKDETIEYVIAVLKDISRRKQAEKAALEATAFTENLIKIANVMIIGLDADGKVQLFNPMAEKVTGYQKSELAGMNWFEVIAPKDRFPFFYSEFDRILNGGAPVMYENAILTKDGTQRYISWSNNELCIDEKIVGVLLFGIDITDRKLTEHEKEKLESRLRQSQKMEALGTLAGGIAHDFNNILTPIIGYAEMTLLETGKETRLFNRMKDIYKAGLRARDLIYHILTFSRQADYETRPVRVQSIIKEALKLIRPSLPSTIEVKFDIDESCGSVMADPTQIYQIIMNLCTNAYHAMRDKGGVLDVCLKEIVLNLADKAQFDELTPGAYVLIEINDTGVGMDPETVDRIFEPYFTTKPKEEGTGLGLAVVHGIVKSFSGCIKVYSEKFQGSSFRIYLPRIEEVYDKRTDDDQLELPTGSERILIVDDEISLIKFMKSLLKQLGYSVTEFTDSRLALNAFKKDPDRFDLVITDMTMPNMTGLQLAREIFEVVPDKPVIICTGFSEQINKETAQKVGISAFLNKPIIIRDLAQTIRQVLG